MRFAIKHARSCNLILNSQKPFSSHKGSSAQRRRLSSQASLLANTYSAASSRRKVLWSILGTGAAFLGATAFQTTFGVAMASAAEDKAAQVLQKPDWPDELPFTSDDFQKFDESPDTVFYSQPRFVTHIDDQAIGAITKYYEQALPPSGSQDKAVLDLCSSWISHYPENYKLGRISGMGLNGDELARNSVLTDYEVKDLNVDPKLPYEDNTFDVITNVVSVDYLTKPIEIFKEMHRVLKPGGKAIMSFSNRCFPTKAIAVWTRTGDLDHVWIVGAYYHYSVPGGMMIGGGRDSRVNFRWRSPSLTDE